jgi:hypothetical protein
MTNDEKGWRTAKVSLREEVSEKSAKGRIRLARQANKLYASLADENEDVFRPLGAGVEIGLVRVLKVRFAGIEGGSAKPELDMRLLDFHLTEKYLAGAAPAAPKIASTPPTAENPLPSPAPEPAGRSSLWITIGLGGVFLLGLLAVAAVVIVSRLKSGETPRPVLKKKNLHE